MCANILMKGGKTIKKFNGSSVLDQKTITFTYCKILNSYIQYALSLKN